MTLESFDAYCKRVPNSGKYSLKKRKQYYLSDEDCKRLRIPLVSKYCPETGSKENKESKSDKLTRKWLDGAVLDGSDKVQRGRPRRNTKETQA